MTLYTLQFLRFIASLLVLFFHLNLFNSGYKGVDVFFVISGFVMYYTFFFKKPPKAFEFTFNRFSKIFFLYWVALVLLYLIMPYKIDILFLKTFLLIPGHQSILGVSWSLSYELYFYLLTGVIVFLIPVKYRNSVFLFLLIVSSLVTLINLSSQSLKGSALNFFLGPNLWEFLLGGLSAFLSTSYFKLIKPNISLLAALLCGLLLLSINIIYASPFSYIVYGLLSFSIVFFITGYEQNRSVNDDISTLFKVLGDASYSIYLFGPIITIIVIANNNLSKIIIIITTIVFSIIFNQIIESKFLRWSRGKINIK